MRALPLNIRSAKVAPEGATEVKLPDHPLFNNIAGIIRKTAVGIGNMLTALDNNYFR